MAQIIAELCQNHNGDLDILDDMVRDAAAAGADYVKIQSCLSKDLSFRERFETGEEEDGAVRTIKRPYQQEYDRLSKLDLDDEAHHHFIKRCAKYGVKPLTTVFNRTRIPFLASLPWPEKSIKVASFDCRSKPLLKDLVDHGFEKIFISTGTTYDHEIKETADYLNDLGVNYTFLHCVSIYPTPIEHGHLERINFLRNFTDNVGFSEHSSYEKDGLKLSLGALMYDIDVIERHFTILPKSQTRDGKVSLNQEETKELVNYSNMDRDQIEDIIDAFEDEYNIMKGQETRELSRVELLNRDYYQGRFANFDEEGNMTFNWETR
tara:strand:+ start:341 stop:1303 length:963 start_codon:yes stop_codon:yes gene_type:complete